MGARTRIGSLGRDAQADAIEAEIRAELDAHLALAEEALRAQGRTHDEARTEARARFGDLERTLRACRRERMGGRLMLVRIQWIVIALLGLTSLALALYGRSEAVRASTARDYALMDATQARARLDELSRLQSKVPVDQIVVGVGDELETFDRKRQIDFGTRAVVQRDGEALFPEIGWVDVAGKTRRQVEELLTAEYSKLYDGLVVDVVVYQD